MTNRSIADVDETRDAHLDFDMFDYIYGLVSTVTAWEATLSPLDHPITKFDRPHINKRRKFDANGNKIKLTDVSSIEYPRVISDGNNSIILRSDEKEHFDDMIQICEMYKFEYEGPIQHTLESIYWEWELRIKVPTISPNYPELIEDYFNDLGIPLEKVMHKRWVTMYRSKMKRLQEDAEERLNTAKLEKHYRKAVTKVWRDSNINPDKVFKELIDALDKDRVKYGKISLKRRFESEFESDEYKADTLDVTDLFSEEGDATSNPSLETTVTPVSANT